MHQKGFTNIVLAVLIVILAGAIGYFVWKKPVLVTQVSAPTESDILVSLKADWQTVQTLIPFRPVYHNQEENAKNVWRAPTSIQFIGNNNLLARFEDDNNVHVAVLTFDGGKFGLLKTFQNQGEFAPSDWQNLKNTYGEDSYPESTYAIDLVRNGELVTFEDWTDVPENIFLKNYWQTELIDGNTQTGTGTGTIQPDDPQKFGLALLPDLPLSPIPSQPVSVKFTVDHRTALNGKTITIRGVVISTLLGEAACSSGGDGTSPSPMGCAQPRIFLADTLEENRNKNYDIMVLVSEAEKDYSVGQTVEVKVVVASNKSSILLQKSY